MTPETLLYGRWRATRDSEAFREIVERHLGMVYATARRILASNEDAEEVAQECFERLAMEKTEIRENLAGWLYRSAARRALDKSRSEGARKARERRYAEHLAPTDEPSWDDIYAYVDEAIATLPNDLRSAIVLRYFEGHTHEAAAVALGVSQNTVMNRVKRGVEEIRRRLGEKGVVAGVTLAAALTGLKSEAAPAGLAASVNKIALAGWAGASAATYLSSVTAGALIMKNTIVGLAVTLACVAIGLGVYTARRTPSATPIPTAQDTVKPAMGVSTPPKGELAASEKKPDKVEAPAPKSEQSEEALKPNLARVDGMLVDAHGVPLATYSIVGIRLDGVEQRREDYTHTDEAGKFTLNNIDPGRYWITTIGSKKPDRQFAPPKSDPTVLTLIAGEKKTGVVVRFTEGTTVSGRVVDEKGKPIPAANVMAQPDGATPSKDRYPILAEATAAVQDEFAGRYNFHSARTQTGEDGRFVLVNLFDGEGHVSVAKEGYRQADRPVENGATDLEIVLEKMKVTVSGQVVDAASGRPLPDADICLYPAWPGSAGALSERVHFDKKADGEGRFTLTNENASGVGFVIARAKGHLAEGVNLGPHVVSEDGQIGDVVVALHASRKARGKVMDDQQKGMADVNLFLGYAPNPDFSMFAEMSIGETNKDGTFEVSIASDVVSQLSAATQKETQRKGDYYVGDSVTIPAGTTDVEGLVLTLSLDGASVSGALTSEQVPAPRVRVIAKAKCADFNMYTLFEGKSDEAGHYTVGGLPPATYEVYVQSSICPGFGPYAPPVGQGYKITGVSKEISVGRKQSASADLEFVSGDSEIVGHLRPLGAEPDTALSLYLSLTRSDGSTQTYWLDTETDGSFRAAGLPAGEARWMFAYVRGKKVYRWSGTVQLGAGASVTLTPEVNEGNQTLTW